VSSNFNSLCAQKFQLVQISSQLQKPVRTKLSLCKIIRLKLLLVIFITAKIVTVCFNKTGNIQDNKNKKEIAMIIASFLCYTIYNANQYR
jgi:hypothetical protein